jgi:hypothetical protein
MCSFKLQNIDLNNKLAFRLEIAFKTVMIVVNNYCFIPFFYSANYL